MEMNYGCHAKTTPEFLTEIFLEKRRFWYYRALFDAIPTPSLCDAKTTLRNDAPRFIEECGISTPFRR